jgi:hypothetical protein
MTFDRIKTGFRTTGVVLAAVTMASLVDPTQVVAQIRTLPGTVAAQPPVFQQPPLLPPALPPPKISVPPVPQLDATMPMPKADLPQRGSFSDRFQSCYGEASARGLGPSASAAYSSACANRD